MSLPRYAEYRDSGAFWLGSIPAHWSAARLKEVIRSIDSGVSVNAIDVPATDGAIGVLKTSCVYDGTFRYAENKAVVDDDLARVSCPVEEGTLIVSRMNTPALVGAAGLVTQSHPNIYLPDRLWQVSLRGVSPSFMHYWTLSREYRAQVEVACSGTSSSMQNLGQDQFKNFQIVLPLEDEQSAIATFLDRETAKIDALIAEQEKLLTLLAEKRQATISHAVTRGLNPNAPMKDSGIPWLGEVPAHWDVVMLRRVVIAFEQGWSPECETRSAEEQEWGVLKAGCVNGGQFRPEEHKALPESLQPRPELEVRHGDVLMSRASGSPQLIGSVACLDHPPARLMLSDKIFRLRLAQDIAPRFFAYAMRSVPLRAQIERAIGGAEGLANNLPQARIKDFWFAVPPEAEQHGIARHIEQALDRFDSLESQAQRSIALLKERRSALIADAVTGKIDVRLAGV